jgi:DNA-binding transcriptional ArsR family regulator
MWRNDEVSPLDAVCRLGKALGDPTRVRALAALRRGEVCLCQLIDLLELAPSTVSRHLDLLHRAGLVARRKEGRWHWFRLAGDDAPAEVRRALRWALESVERDPRLEGDDRRLGEVLAKDPTEVAACYRS